jgi:hypothetical protein
MKIKEILAEKKLATGEIPHQYHQASAGLHTFSDGERSNTDYTHYRLGLALAMCDGKNKPDIDPKTFYGKKHTAHPYTQIEHDMLKQGYEVVGAKWDDLNGGDMLSRELESTNKTSPVAKPKKNKYGI